MSNAANPPADMKERLAVARKAKEEREKAAKAAAELAELHELELEEKYTKEFGERGKSFEIVMTDEGAVVLKLGPGILYTRFEKALDKSKTLDESDVDAFVTPCLVEPAEETWRVWVARRPVIGTRCSNALVTLFGARKVEEQKKF